MGWSRSGEVTESEPIMANSDENGRDDSSVEELTWDNTEKMLDGQTIENVPNATINETLSVDEVSTSEKGEKEGRFEGKCQVGCKNQEDLEEMAADEVKREREDMTDESLENLANNSLETREEPDDCEKSEDETLNDEWSSMEISTDSSGASPNHSTGAYCIKYLNIINLNNKNSDSASEDCLQNENTWDQGPAS